MINYEQYISRQENILSILTEIRLHGPQTRRQLEKSLCLSWGCISEITSMLVTDGVLLEEKSAANAEKGRTPYLLRMNPDKLFAGVDINNMGLNICVCSISGKKLYQCTSEIQCGTEAQLYNCVTAALGTVLKKEPDKFLGIGAAMQGVFDKTDNVWEYPGSNGILRVDFKEMLEKEFNLPVIVEHDPNCILFGSFDAESDKSIMMVRVDKGIGAAIYSGGEFFSHGKLELGYNVVGCGMGRLHDYAGIDAVQSASGKNIDELAKIAAYDSAAMKCFHDCGRYLGIALGNVCNLLHVDEIAVAGQMIKYAHLFFDVMIKEYEAVVIPSQKAIIKPVDVTDAAYGAAKLAAVKYPYGRD
ncbi:MAG: ROK family protein [Clostridia bacterium]|nr:ROK family protein [Clostridia bacterium]